MINRCICGTSRATLLFTAGAYSIVRCDVCGQARTVTPKSVKRTQEYAASDVLIYVEKESMFRKLFQEVLTFIRKYTSRGVFLEIGAGVGLLVDEANKAGFEAYGIEPSTAAVSAAKKYFGIPLILGEFPKKSLNKKADVVVLNHVLEHLPNPKQAIQDISASLRSNGLLIVGVPNSGSFLAVAKQSRWQSLIADQHRWHFTRRTLDALVCPQGFTRIALSSNNHDRSIHPPWKLPLYAILDTISTLAHNGEAILAAYRKDV